MRESANRTVFFSGLICFIAMLLYFFLIRMARVNYMNGFHFVNLAMIFLTNWLCVHRISRLFPRKSYFGTFFAGMSAAVLGALAFDFFFLVYSSLINSTWFLDMRESSRLGNYMTPIIVVTVYLTEQIGSSVIFTLLLMFMYKTKGNRS
jgi:hypothetical protein